MVRDRAAGRGVGFEEDGMAMIGALYGRNHAGLGVVGRTVGDPPPDWVLPG